MSDYIDLQVNGYAGVDFNASDLTLDEFNRAARTILSDGTAQFLPTLITAPWDEMLRKVDQIATWIDEGKVSNSQVLGLHLEGPFLSPEDGYIGAHPKDAAIPATVDKAKELLDSARGHVQLVTLAPEVDPAGRVTRFFSDRGITVAAGHSNASRDELACAIDQGLSLYTHLGNGCPASLPRHDNIIQRVLSLSDRLFVSFIADGHHVPPVALANYLRCIPNEHVIIVTDAISAAGLGAGRYELSGQSVEVDEDGAAWASCRTHFAGCATPFPRMVGFLKREIGATDKQVKSWFRDNPLRLLKRDSKP